MRGVSRPTQKLPSSDQPPNVMLSKELVSPTDVRFVSTNQMVLVSVCRQLVVLLLYFTQGRQYAILIVYCIMPSQQLPSPPHTHTRPHRSLIAQRPQMLLFRVWRSREGNR